MQDYQYDFSLLEAKPKEDRNLRIKHTIAIIRATVLSVFSFLFLMPLLWLADVSFRPKDEIFQVPPRIFEAAPWETLRSYSLSSFRLAVERYHVNSGFYNSILITICTIILTLLICSLAAYALGAMKFRGRDTIFNGILLTMMLPTITMLAPYYRVLQSYGLLNRRSGLVITYSASAFGAFLLRQYIIKLPKSFFESALIDGASHFRIWWQLVLPLTKPGLAALAIYQFRLVWNDFLTPMIVLYDDSLFTLPNKLQFMDSVNIAKDYNAMVATGLIAILIPIICFIFFQRYFIESLSGGINE